jgi:hypothetical protein
MWLFSCYLLSRLCCLACLTCCLLSPCPLQLLPSDPHKAANNLAVVEQELAVMDQQHKQIQSHAQRWSRRWLVAGCTGLALQVRLQCIDAV